MAHPHTNTPPNAQTRRIHRLVLLVNLIRICMGEMMFMGLAWFLRKLRFEEEPPAANLPQSD
jgi:hypothetical protein